MIFARKLGQRLLFILNGRCPYLTPYLTPSTKVLTRGVSSFPLRFGFSQNLPKRITLLSLYLHIIFYLNRTLGCATNLWVKCLPCGAILPEILPTAAQDGASESDNAVCSFDRPMHARLFESLPNDGAATSFDHS